jgi:hypothetical protein
MVTIVMVAPPAAPGDNARYEGIMKVMVALLGLSFLGIAVLAGDQEEAEKNGAVESLRIINNAQRSYAHAYPEIGYACDLAKFAVPHDGIPTPEHSGMLEDLLIKGTRNGYSYLVFCGDVSKPQRTYRAAALPAQGGLPAYCTDESGVIRSARDGKPGTCFSKGTPAR